MTLTEGTTPAREIVTPDRVIRPGYGELVMRDVAQAHGTTVAELRSRHKPARLVRARIDAARRLTDLGYTRTLVGRIMRRDHTTISWYLGACPNKRQPLAKRGVEI